MSDLSTPLRKLQTKDLSGFGHSERRLLRNAIKRVEKLKRSASASHWQGKDDASTIELKKRRALKAIDEAQDATTSPHTAVLLVNLKNAVEATQASRVT